MILDKITERVPDGACDFGDFLDIKARQLDIDFADSFDGVNLRFLRPEWRPVVQIVEIIESVGLWGILPLFLFILFAVVISLVLHRLPRFRI